jgi:peptidoglycan/LPS O-acetylase OafA/YrhL
MSSFSAAAKAKVPALDHLRALAITLVFLFHYRLFAHPDWVDTVGSFGWTGVDLFFVLSGYLIAHQVFTDVQQHRFSVRTFFIKRFFRILPAYWVVLILYFAIPAFKEWESLPPLWKFLTFTQNFGLDLRYQRTFSHAWSLCIEEQFYFLFPVCVWIFSFFKTGKKLIWLIPVLMLAGIFIRIFCWNKFVVPAIDTDVFGMTWYKHIYYPTYNRLDGILAGMGIAAFQVYYKSGHERVARYANIFLVAGLLLAVCAWFLCADPYRYVASIWGFPLVAAAFGCCVLSGSHSQSILNRYRSRITSTIADLSFSLYLTHKAAIHLTQNVGEKWGLETDGTWMFLLSLLTAVAFALVIRMVVEKPFLLIRKKILIK